MKSQEAPLCALSGNQAEVQYLKRVLTKLYRRVDKDDESGDIYYDEVYVCDVFVYSEVSARGAKRDAC